MIGETNSSDEHRQERIELAREFAQAILLIMNDEEKREFVSPVLAELRSVIQMVAVEVMEIRSSRAIRSVLGIASAS